MSKVLVSIELLDAAGESTMRWEQKSAESLGAFMLLGRAFELAQRDTGAGFHDALAAFFKSALIQKGDVAMMLQRMEEK